MRVLDSQVSESMRTWLRIPDGALGAFAYLSEAVFALAGSTRRWQYRPWLVVAFGLLLVLVGATLVVDDRLVVQRFVHEVWPVIFPIGALVALGSVWRSIADGRDGRAFVRSAVMIGLLLITGGIGMYPNLLISTTDPAYSLTAANAAAADNTLQITLLVALIGMPFVLLYTSGAYYIFRGKAEVEPEGY